MQTAIATVSLSRDLASKLKAIAAAGFYGVEIFEADLLSFDGTPREVGRLIADLGLKLVAFQPFRDFEGMPEPQRARGFARAERKFELMHELGTDLLLVCSNVLPAAIGGIDRAAADFRELGEAAAKHGIKVGYEALAWGRHVSDHRDAWEIVRRADHPHVGLILDSFHTLSRGLPVDSIRSIPGDRIFLVQIADAPRLDMDILSWSRHFRNFPGQGDLPIVPFMQALGDTGYDGVISLEIFNDQFRAGSTAQVAVDGQRSLIYLMDQTGPRAKSAALPPRSVCSGFEFVEFAVEDHAAEQLAGLFAMLGFAKIGTHRSKAVTHWRQGDINLVINAESESFAHTYNIVHGPSVCAIGMRVGDAAETMARAAGLKAQPFRHSTSPGELELPAIRAVGGSLLYFIEPKGQLGRIWESEFTPSGAGTSGAAGAGLVCIDHISQSMHYDEMLSWLLFYTALFELDKSPQAEIADPAGIVRSQVVRSPDHSVSIVLNGSQSAKTLSSRFLSEFFGAGVQHIAFASDDIFATVTALRANGLQMLPIPENYYDDLEARFDLDQSLLARLRENNVMYERNEEGEFFQVYTQPFAERFFFEIVQRKAGYAGFGASNAPIRLAAQTRLAPPPTLPKH